MPGVIRLLCTPTERCSFHQDGGDVGEKCPGECATVTCCCEGLIEINDEVYCSTCASRMLGAN